MSKLNIDQKTVLDLFSAKKTDFLIPDYQRPYAWEETECLTLWNDLVDFAIPEEDETKFDKNDEYYLGPIVTFQNNDKLEVIDGQQRLTTLLLLLRAFYDKFENMADRNSKASYKNIEKCIWKIDEYDEANKNELKIDSEVATDNDKEEFLKILKEGKTTDNQKSRYANNFRFFKKRIDDYVNRYPSYVAPLAMRIMKNTILLPIEADAQDTALRIFSTLNDRGKPLADADIFKAQFYKFFTSIGRKQEFIDRWKVLEEKCTSTFKPSSYSTTPLDEAFTRYMYYLRASQNITSTTTEALRKFYERNSYAVLKNEKTLSDIEILTDFWIDVAKQNDEVFSEEVLRKLFVLNYAPNGMWYNLVSVYFLTNRDQEGYHDQEQFAKMLDKTIAFVWAYAMTNPGVGTARTPVFAEMAKIYQGEEVKFETFKFDTNHLRSVIGNFAFLNSRALTRAWLAWWMMQHPSQELPSLDTTFDIEHIYARNRKSHENSNVNVESLGNKALLERRINIRASDYRFSDKRTIYQGRQNPDGSKKDGTHVAELLTIASTHEDFSAPEITSRYTLIVDAFIDYLEKNELVKG